MRFIVCTVDVDPCPAANVAALSVADATDFASLGVTAPQLLSVMSWGFAFVVSMWFFGYVIAVALNAIRRV